MCGNMMLTTYKGGGIWTAAVFFCLEASNNSKLYCSCREIGPRCLTLILSIFLFQCLNLSPTSCQLHISRIFFLAVVFIFCFPFHILFSRRSLITSLH